MNQLRQMYTFVATANHEKSETASNSGTVLPLQDHKGLKTGKEQNAVEDRKVTCIDRKANIVFN